MFFQSSRGISLFAIAVWSTLLVTSAYAQGPDTVLASVNGVEITLKQVDDSVAARIYPLQQQLYAIRKATLENLVTSKLLESEAAARGISIIVPNLYLNLTFFSSITAVAMRSSLGWIHSSSLTVPVNGIITSGLTTIPRSVQSAAASKMARTCICTISGMEMLRRTPRRPIIGWIRACP